MTAVMRREFGTAEPPSSEVELGRGRAIGLVHFHCLPTEARLKEFLRSGVRFFLSKARAALEAMGFRVRRLLVGFC